MISEWLEPLFLGIGDHGCLNLNDLATLSFQKTAVYAAGSCAMDWQGVKIA
jgi:hypothetical protein